MDSLHFPTTGISMSKRFKQAWVVLVLALAVGMAVAACGGGNSGSTRLFFPIVTT
jgi:hypothetical protein